MSCDACIDQAEEQLLAEGFTVVSQRAPSDAPTPDESSTLVPKSPQDIYAYDVSEHDMSVDREIDRRLGK